MIEPRPYQNDATKAFFDNYKAEKRLKRVLIVLPVGAGKTIVGSTIAKVFHSLEHVRGPVLFIAHRNELLDQAGAKVKMVWEDVRVGKIQGKVDEQDADFIVASIQTLQRGRDIEERPCLIIYDEAHHSAAAGARKVLERMGCFEENGPMLLGITATPNRNDKLELGNIFDQIIYEKTMISLILEGYLVDIRGKRIVAKELNLDHVDEVAGDFNTQMLSEQMENEHTIAAVANAIVDNADKRKTIVFAVSVKQAYMIDSLLNENGISSRCIDGKLDMETRATILNDFHEDKFQVLVNCMILTEGYDEPAVSCIVIARPTKSQSLYTQMIGRGTRLHPEKTDLMVLDIVDASKNKTLITLSELIKVAEVYEEDIKEHKELELAELEEQESILEFHKRIHTTIGKKMYEVNLFKDIARYLWLKVNEECYFITFGKNKYIFLLKESSDKWWALLEDEQNKLVPLFHDSVSLEYAQGVAELFLKSVENPLFQKLASWRNDRITDGQRKFLLIHDVKDTENWTKGEASTAITQITAMQKAKDLQKLFSPDIYREMMKIDYLKEQVNQNIARLKKSVKV